MRDTIVGLVLAAFLIGGLFAADKYAPNTRPVPPAVAVAQMATQAAADVHRGFVGTKNIGLWQLTCADKPTIMTVPLKDASKPAGTTPAKTATVKFGRCRTTLYYRRKDNPKQVMLAVTFRFIGEHNAFGVFVLMPPIVKQGDIVALRIPQGILKLPVAGCEPKGLCVARGALQPGAEDEFLKAKAAQLVIPQASGKPALLPMPMTGLDKAIDAMKRAES
jgi:invasion protein IalB